MGCSTFSNYTVLPEISLAKINKAAIKQPDIMASNGVIHVIDQVILPE